MEVKSWFISVWTLLDPLYYTCTRLKRIDSEREKNVFRVRLMKYRGKRVDFPDGSSLERGDLVVRIHLHNVYILQEMAGMNNELARAKWLYNTVRRSLPGVHDYLNNHPKKEQLKGIVGITLLNRGNRSLGFRTLPLYNPIFRLFRWVTLLPIHLLSADQPIRTLKKHRPVYLYMSKDELEARYGAK